MTTSNPPKPVDWRRFGFPDETLDVAGLACLLDETAANLASDLVEADPEADATPFPLRFPPNIEALLLRVLDDLATRQGEGWSDHIHGHLLHYTQLMPSLRVAQTQHRRGEAATLFRAELDWAALPRLCAALDRLFGVFEAAGVDLETAFGYANADAWRAGHRDLAEVHAATYFGGLMPMLYALPADCKALGQEIAAGADVLDVIDRRLAGSVIHELSHLTAQRRALDPPYLDECVSGYFGVRSLPAIAFPAPGEDNAMFLALWFSQLGQLIAGGIGLHAMTRAHAGVVPWSTVLPLGLEALWSRWGWEQQRRTGAIHFLGEVQRPAPWVKALYLALAKRLPSDATMSQVESMSWEEIPVSGAPNDEDVQALHDGLMGMCLWPSVDAGVYRVTRKATAATVIVDAVAGVIYRDAPPHVPEPGPFRYILAPRVGAALRRAGHATVSLAAYPPERVDALVTDVIAKVR